jgi:osmotically-inducible protein OsmY
MKRQMLLLAGLLAAGSLAQAIEPTWRSEADRRYADEPVATAMSGKSAADDMIVKSLVEALNNDASMKGSKISVSNDSGLAVLRGTTQTEQQVRQAEQLAAASAGEGNVIVSLQPAKISYFKPPQILSDPQDQQVDRGDMK